MMFILIPVPTILRRTMRIKLLKLERITALHLLHEQHAVLRRLNLILHFYLL